MERMSDERGSEFQVVINDGKIFEVGDLVKLQGADSAQDYKVFQHPDHKNYLIFCNISEDPDTDFPDVIHRKGKLVSIDNFAIPDVIKNPAVQAAKFAGLAALIVAGAVAIYVKKQSK